jgi:Domain of unknown function (DUF4936)
MDLYIYYRVGGEHTGALREKVTALQQSLRRDYAIAASLKRRPEETQGMQTWMEVYLDVPPGFDTTLAEAVTRYGLMPLIAGERHTEYFLEIPPCA